MWSIHLRHFSPHPEPLYLFILLVDQSTNPSHHLSFTNKRIHTSFCLKQNSLYGISTNPEAFNKAGVCFSFKEKFRNQQKGTNAASVMLSPPIHSSVGLFPLWIFSLSRDQCFISASQGEMA